MAKVSTYPAGTFSAADTLLMIQGGATKQASGGVPPAGLATQAANTVLGNFTAGVASPTASGISALATAMGFAGGANAEQLLLSNFGICVPSTIGGSVVQTLGAATPNVLDTCAANVGSSTADAPSGYIRRQRYRSAASAINRVAGIWFNVMQVRGDIGLPTNGRFPVILQAAIGDASPTLGNFVLGIQGSTTPNFTATEPSVWATDNIFLCCDSADGNLFLRYNDNAGAATSIDLGAANFPRTRYNVYEIVIDKNAAGTEYYVKARNVTTNVDSTTYTLTVNIPRATVDMYPTQARSSMASIFQADLDFAGMSVGKWPTPDTSVSETVQTLVNAASTIWDRTSGAIARLATVSPGDTIAAPTGFVAGKRGTLFIQCGANAPLWNAAYDFGDAGLPDTLITGNTNVRALLIDVMRIDLAATGAKYRCAYGGTYLW